MEDYDGLEGQAEDILKKMGVPKTPAGYDLPGAELSIFPIKKAKFAETMYEHQVPAYQAKMIWKFYSDQINSSWDKYRLSQGQQSAAEFDRSGWDSFAKANGIDSDLAGELFGEYETELTGLMDARAEQAEEAAAQAEAQGQAEEPEGEIISKEQARLYLTKIQNDPKHPYNDPNAPQQEHELAVAGVLRLYGIINGIETTIDGYAEKFFAEKDAELKESYGLSGSLYKSGDYSASNRVQADQSLKGDDGGADEIAQDQEGGGVQ